MPLVFLFPPVGRDRVIQSLLKTHPDYINSVEAPVTLVSGESVYVHGWLFLTHAAFITFTETLLCD